MPTAEQSAYYKEYYAKNREKILARQNAKYKNGHRYNSSNPEYSRNLILLRKYGITLKQWESTLEAQGKVCKVCGASEPRGGRWHTDHNHSTGEVCGIICLFCNTGMGHFEDNPQLVYKAAAYLVQTRINHEYPDVGC